VDGKACLFEIIINYYFHTMLLDASACKKRTLKALKRGNKLSIKTVGDLRKKHLEERGNDMIQARSNMDFGLKFSTV